MNDRILNSLNHALSITARYKAIEDAKSVELTEKVIRWRKYRREVDRLTSKQDLSSILHIEKRGTEWHLDHKVSVWFGFTHNIPPQEIADVSNLRMLPRSENISKMNRCYFFETKIKYEAFVKPKNIAVLPLVYTIFDSVIHE